jgi:hypothetical protein
VRSVKLPDNAGRGRCRPICIPLGTQSDGGGSNVHRRRTDQKTMAPALTTSSLPRPQSRSFPGWTLYDKDLIGRDRRPGEPEIASPAQSLIFTVTPYATWEIYDRVRFPMKGLLVKRHRNLSCTGMRI